jgi:hypothetical protein
MELPEPVQQITDEEAQELRKKMEELDRLLRLGAFPDMATGPVVPPAPVYTTRLSNSTNA